MFAAENVLKTTRGQMWLTFTNSHVLKPTCEFLCSASEAESKMEKKTSGLTVCKNY